MTASSLPAALRAGAEGLYALEAAAGLIIAHGTWLARDDDFGCFIHHGADTAAIDWEAAIDALHAGRLPCSGGERRMLHLGPASPTGRPSARARPSPASTTATSACWSWRSATPPDDASSLASG
jgi:hypothetical protein